MANLLSFLCVFLCFTLELHVGLAARNPRFLQDADGDDIGISEIDLNLENENSATTNERKLGGLPPLPDLPFGIPNPVNKIKQKFSPSRHLGGLPTSDPRFLQEDDAFGNGGQIDALLEDTDSATTNERKLGGLPPLPDLPFGIPNPLNKIKAKFNPPAKSSPAHASTARHLGGLPAENTRFLQEDDSFGISSQMDELLEDASTATNERKLGGLPPLPDLPFGIPNPVNKIKEKFSPAKSSHAPGSTARHLGGLPPLPDLPFGIPNPVNKLKEKFNPPAKSSHATASNARHLGGLPPLPDLPFGIPNPVNKIKQKFSPSGVSSHATGSTARHLGGLPPLPDLPFGIPNPLNKIKGKMSASRNLGGLPDIKLPFAGKLPKLPFSDIFHKEDSHSSSHHSPMGTHQPSGATNQQQSASHGTQSHGEKSREEQLQEAAAIGKALGQQIAAEATKKQGQASHGGQGMSSLDFQHIQHSHDPIPHGLSSFDQQHSHLGRDPHDHGHSLFGQQHAQPGQASHGQGGQSGFGQQQTKQGFNKPKFYYGHE